MILPQENIAFRATETPTETCFVGRIQSEMSDQFVLSVERILLDKMWLPTTGKTLVQGRKEKGGSEGEKYTYGDRIFILGELSLPRQVRNPGEWNYRNYLASQGIHALLRLKQEPVLVERNTQFSIWKVVYFLKGFLRQRIQNALDPKEQGLIQGLLLGERGSLSFDLKTAFVQTGTVHILAISGLHVGMIIFGVLFLLKFFRIRRKARFMIAMIVIWIYALIAGSGPSVMRAMIMAEIYLLGKLLGRPSLLLNSLFVSILVILTWNPLQILDLGLWLSALCVLALILLVPCYHPMIENYPRIAKPIVMMLLNTLSILIVITPIISHYFNLFYPVAFLANLVVIPLSFLLLSTGFLAAFLGPIGNWLWQDLRLLEAVFTWIVEICAQIPAGFWFVPRLPLWTTVLYYIFLFLIVVIPSNPLRKIPKLLILWLLFLNLLFWFPLIPAFHSLRVTFFDVGHGDAALVELPKGETLLVDTGMGNLGGLTPRFHPVVTYLRSRGIRFLDGVILSHADQDHIGALEMIHQQVRVAQLWDNGFPDPSAERYRRLFQKEKRYQTLNQGEQLANSSFVKLICLHPAKEELQEFYHRNDASLVMRLSYGESRVLLTGDLEGRGVVRLLRFPPEELRCTLLKVPHHGSLLEPFGEKFFLTIHPKVAIVSISARNQWGLPNPLVLKQLEGCGSQVLITAKEGACSFETDGKTNRVISLKSPRPLWYTWSVLKGAQA